MKNSILDQPYDLTKSQINFYKKNAFIKLKEVLDNILTASPSKEGLLDNLTKFIPSSQFSNEVKKPSL